MQPGSVYQMVYRLTLMSLLFMQCNRWMTDVKLTCLYNNHLCHLTPETWKSYGGGKKQYWAEFHFWASRLWEKDVGVTSNQISDTERAIKLVQPTLCPLSCVTDRLPRVISRPEWLRLLGFYYLPLCTWRAVGHPSWVRLRALCLKRRGKKKNTPASHLLCGYLQTSDGGAHHGQPETCWAEQLWRTSLPWSQQLSQRSSDVRKNNIDS